MISFSFIILTSLFFPGILTRVKSILAGRKGPDLVQHLKDIGRLLKKGTVLSKTTSLIFRIAPSVYFSSVVTAAFLIPFGSTEPLLSFTGDFVFFAYILALGKFFLIISSLDTGSSFEGMGASREALYSMLAEPAFFVLIGSFALYTGETSFTGIFSHFDFNSNTSLTLAFIATFILIIIALIENSRMPVDDPRTHLELTMVHEVMILDNSGFDLALIQQTANLKFALYGALIANIFISPSLSALGAVPVFLTVQVLFAITVGVLESFATRFRMQHNAQYILAVTAIALLGFFGVLISLPGREL